MTQLTIQSLNISEKKGTVKIPVNAVEIDFTGVKGDAHAGKWHRQVSLLGVESIKKAEEQNNRPFVPGDFGENLTTEGLELHKTNVLDRFQSGDVLLEVTQIGKKCHSGCEIFKTSGNCIMPIEGIFCRVLQPGILKKGDLLTYIPRVIRIKVITLSDRASQGEYEDKSGPFAQKLLAEYFENQRRPVHFDTHLIPDNKKELKHSIREAIDANTDIIVTTGGTGIGSRDITPDVVRKMLNREIPGIMEFIRVKYGAEKPSVLLSRSVAGVIGKTLVYALPGSVRAVKEYLEVITGTLVHSMLMLYDIDAH